MHKNLFGNNDNDPRIIAISAEGDEFTTTFEKGILNTFNWYLDNKKYYTSLSKKDITKRLGNKW